MHWNESDYDLSLPPPHSQSSDEDVQCHGDTMVSEACQGILKIQLLGHNVNLGTTLTLEEMGRFWRTKPF
jgi:hypothetical protein